ncbi:MAG: TadE/TadG family type IV pilus assembly protein [Solirubrobacteraceae bacterium]
MVEFALVMPLLALLLFGSLKMGVGMNAKIDSTHLTAEGARYAAVNQNPGLTDPDISPKTLQSYIRSRAGTAFLKEGATVCITFPTNPETGTSGKVGDPVTVTVGRLLQILPKLSTLKAADGTPIPGPGDLTIASETTMRLEALPTKIPAGCLT